MIDPTVECKSFLAEAIAKAISTLLSEKHLYQTVRVDTAEIDRAIAPLCNKSTKLASGTEKALQGVLELKFMPWEPRISGRPMPVPMFAPQFVQFDVPHIKIFCPKCERDEPHNPHAGTWGNIIRAVTLNSGDNQSPPAQIIDIYYECQSCKKSIVTFTISRENFKLTLVGRSPMEVVPVPSFIPKEQRHFFSDAIIARNAGHTLPGLFMLRTFIEQYAYSKHSDKKEYADTAIRAYMDSLPSDFKTRFPSLQHAYEQLSIAIHSANADTSLFETVEQQIREHFDAKRLYRI